MNFNINNHHDQKFLPYGMHSINQTDINVLKGSKLTQGDKIIEFEDAISKKIESKFSVAVNSATSALHLACLALGVSKGDIVWTSPISFVASSNCALYCNAKIDFVDINPDTGLIDIKKLKDKLLESKKCNSLPKVLIPVHLTGSSCDMKEIKALSQKYNFSVIEDASHAIGGRYKDSFIGSCKYSDITIFSFHPVKIITAGEGGIATTNNILIAEKIRNLRSHGIEKDSNKFVEPLIGGWHYEQQSLGFNYRITDIQAALGLSQLKRLEEIVQERNSQLNFYYDLLSDLPLTFLKIPPEVYSSVHLAVIRLNKLNKEYYLNVFEGLRSEKIGVQLHYKPIYKHPYYKKYNFDKNNFPGSEIYESTAISIPLFPGLTIDQQIRVKNAIKLFI